ncbi:MAG: serine hydrolase [Ktedonobacteraceae bacterium]|nr:serine hydrolase [Ktedonobacteraceae bacterium]
MGAHDSLSFRRLSRRTFVCGITGLAGLSAASCDLPWHSSPRMPSPPQVRTYYDMSGSYHQAQVKTFSGQGYRLTSLSLYGDPAQPLYAAVWIKRDGPSFRAFQDMDEQQFQHLLSSLGAQGYRPVILTIVGSRAQARFAGVLEQENTSSIVKYHLTSDPAFADPQQEKPTIQYWSAWAGDHAYLLRWGSLYGDTDHPLYAGIWEKQSDIVAWNWDDGFYDSPGDYQRRLAAERDQWARPAFLTLSSDQHAWSLFRDDSANPTVVTFPLTGNDLQTQSQSLQNEGYYPLTLQGSGNASATRFAAIFVQSEQPIARTFRVTGPRVPQLAAYDDLLKHYMQANGIRSASLAIAKEGRLVLAHAYTWAEPGYLLTQPTSLFRIASCTKPLTSIVVHQLLERGLLRLETRMQQILQLRTPHGGHPIDPCFWKVLVWHLLSHMGGWDLSQSFDPLEHDLAVVRAFSAALPATKYQVASYMAGEPLQFEPGSSSAYSPFGYSLLGQIIEKVTGKSYHQVVQEFIFQPLGLKRPRTARSLLRDRAPGEVFYHGLTPYVRPSVVTTDQRLVPYAYGGISMETRDATGATLMAAADYAKVLAAFDIGEQNPLLRPATVEIMWTQPPGAGMLRGWYIEKLDDGQTIIGHEGTFPGATSSAFRRIDGLSCVLFVNKDPQAHPRTLDNAISKLADDISSWPSRDLFPELGIPALQS